MTKDTDRLQAAIVANSAKVVSDLLGLDTASAKIKFGYKVTVKQSGQKRQFDDDNSGSDDEYYIFELPSSSDKSTLVESHIRFSSTEPRSFVQIPLLFLAIRNCYDHPKEGKDEAWEILQQVLTFGARVNDEPNLDFLACNLGGQKFEKVKKSSALDFTLILKGHVQGSFQRERSSVMEKVLNELSQHDGPRSKSVVVPQDTVNLWDRLLSTGKMSDVRFITSDGEHIQAHKCILATASTYFDTQFSTRWNGDEAEVQTQSSGQLVRHILKFIYTGHLDIAVLEAEAPELLDFAAMYDLKDLKTLAESQLRSKISESNLVSYLEKAYLHDCQTLKSACFKMMRRTPALFLDSEMKRLLARHEGLEQEIRSAL